MEELKTAVKKLEREIQKEICYIYWHYISYMFTPTDSDLCLRTPDPTSDDSVYMYVKHQCSIDIPTLKPVADPKQQAELNSQFNKTFSEGETIIIIMVTTQGVENLLANLNFNKAEGPDGISPCVLREFAKEAASILTAIYWSSLRAANHYILVIVYCA